MFLQGLNISNSALAHVSNKESGVACGAFIPAGYHLISLIILAPEIVKPIKSLLIKTKRFSNSLCGKYAQDPFVMPVGDHHGCFEKSD